MIGFRSKNAILLCAIALAVGLAICVSLVVASRSTPNVQGGLVSLDEKNLDTLRGEFNAGVGGTRVIVLLSPT